MDDCGVGRGPTEEGWRGRCSPATPPGQCLHDDRQDRQSLGRTMKAAFLAALIPALAFALSTLPARASDHVAGPEDYVSVVRALVAGDTLTLRPGMYRDGLPLHDIHGDARQPIVIQGPRAGVPAVLLGRPDANTVSLARASYITVRDIAIDGLHLPVDAVKAEGRGGTVHHITLERLIIVGHDFAQDIIAISTKSPAWAWVIRDNLIVGAGTGMYLGSSDGTAAFIAGVIEGNIIVNTTGYNIEIKQQSERSDAPDAPTEQSVTILRNNLFVKSRNASTGHFARPNLLLGHFPLRGSGRTDRYEVVDNVFFDNASEALFQGEGNLVVKGNVFFNPHGDAIVIQPHHDIPRSVSIVDNFVASAGRGVRVRGGDPALEQLVARDAVYAREPLDGGTLRENETGPFSAAPASLSAWLARRGDKARRAKLLQSFERRACAPMAPAVSAPPQPDPSLCAFLRTLIDAVAR